MENPKDTTSVDAPSSASDDIDQVRQLLLGNLPAEQERELAALRDRVAHLEKMVQALIAHGEATHRKWQDDVASLSQSSGRDGTERSVSAQVTPLTPRTRDVTQDAND